MLRISIEECGRETIRYKLEGKIAEPWASELEAVWMESQARRINRKCLVDLTAVSFIDRAGQRVLSQMAAAGAHLRAAGPMTSYLAKQSVQSQKKRPGAATGSSPRWPSTA